MSHQTAALSDVVDAHGEIDVERLKTLPKEIGAFLVAIGVVGLIIPGPIGTPFLLMGGVVLWPQGFERLELAFQRKFPAAHRRSAKWLHRYVTDIERRYPSEGVAS
jgi:hypothetical protein